MCLVKKGVHSNMNKIFKVVWSKTKECYVVVSEMAKNKTGKKKIGGLGCVIDKGNYTILRGTGRNVKANKIKTEKDIEGYKSIRCMQNALNYSRPLYDTLVREM